MGVGNNATDHKGFLLKAVRALRPKISAKIFIYFLIIALVPLIVVSYVLVTAAHERLLKDASAKQQAVAVDLSQRVDNYIANNVNLLAYTARLYMNTSTNTTKNLSLSELEQNLTVLFSQNLNLLKITTFDAGGSQLSLEKLDGKVNVVKNKVSTTEEIFDFLDGKPYFISPGRSENGRPLLTLGVPILKKYDPPTSGLFATQKATVSNMEGFFIANFDITDLWDSVLSTNIEGGGYAYVVAPEGGLMTHPDPKYLSSHRDLKDIQAVRQFLVGDFETKETTSEKNVKVISTPHKAATGLAVIVQEPLSSIYASIDSFIQIAVIVGISATVLSVLTGIFFSRQLIRPIKELALGARRMERGEFDTPIDVKTKDELQELAYTFNRMAQGMKKLIGDLQTNNLRLKIEQIKMNNIISSVSDGVIAVNSTGEIVSINPPAAKLLDQSPKTLEDKLMSEQFHWKHDGEPFMPDLEKGGIYHYADLTLGQGDSIVYLDMTVAVLDHQDSSNIAAIITVHDQTASRELSFMKLDFVAIAAHELRTPLTVVRGYLDMLNTGSAVKELSIFNLENLSKATTGADQLRALINKLLNIARIERGDMEIFIEKLNLSKLVSDNVEEHGSIAAQKEQTIRYSSNTESTVYVPADTASIVEVLNNLIGNALKYTSKNSQIKVNLIVNKEEARVEIVDNGPGIPEELRDKLFTKFYRAERSLIAGSRGTGLGLFISKTVIELQHGRIGIEPDAGNGSTFYFTLPIYDPAKDDEIIAKKSSGGIRGWFKKRPTS